MPSLPPLHGSVQLARAILKDGHLSGCMYVMLFGDIAYVLACSFSPDVTSFATLC